MSSISTLGINNLAISQILNGQTSLTQLSSELSTGQKSLNLADYSPADTANILSLNSTIDRTNGYQGVINTVQPVLATYQSSLDGVLAQGNTVEQLVSSLTNNTSTTIADLGSQIQSALSNVAYYLNQQVGNTYIFSGTGSRSTTIPVISDFSTLPVPPTETGPTTSPALPAYDTAYVAGATPPSSSTAAYATTGVQIDDNLTVPVGVSSNDPAIQNLVLGMRYAYAATQDPANASAYAAQARSLITTGISGVQALETHVVGQETQFSTTQTDHTNLLSDLTGQLGTIQNADSATVSAQITALQTQIEASYTVIGKIANLSLTKYL